MSKLPPLTQEPIIHIDATPDDGYVLRILRAYLENTKCKWESNKPDLILDSMNEDCDKRAALLKRAIRALKEKP